MPEAPTWNLETDQPLEKKEKSTQEQDLYGRQSFATHLIKSLEKADTSQNSIVCGLEGMWGCGKTSVLNIAKEILEVNTSKPIIVDFNPWWFIGRDDLALQFFGALANSLQSEIGEENRDMVSKALRSLGGTSKKYLPLLRLFAGKDRTEGLDEILSAMEASGDILEVEKKSLNERKKTVAKTLSGLSKPIWVILDDIDRLLPNEAIEVLTLIRGVGDLPNIRYLLAYDRTQLENRIASALSGTSNDARDYINKIVQLSFPIPNPHPQQLQEHILSKIQGHMEISEEMNYDFKQLLNTVCGTLIRTPRDMKRILNAFFITLNLVDNELYPVDIFGLELLRLEFPRLYESLPRYKTNLINDRQMIELLMGKREEKDMQLEDLLKRTIPQELALHAGNLLSTLFPAIKNKVERSPQLMISGMGEFEENFQRRIASQVFFDWYFQRGIDPEILSAKEASEIEDFLDQNQAEELIAYFKRKSKELTPKSIKRVHLVISQVNDSLGNNTSQKRLNTLIKTLKIIKDGLDETVGTEGRSIPISQIFLLLISHQARILIMATKNSFNVRLDLFDWHKSTKTNVPYLDLILFWHGCQSTFAESEFENSNEENKESAIKELKYYKKARTEQVEIVSDQLPTTPSLLASFLFAWTWANSLINPDERINLFLEKRLKSHPIETLLLAVKTMDGAPLVSTPLSKYLGISSEIVPKYLSKTQLKDTLDELAKDTNRDEFVAKYGVLLDKF